MKNTRACKKMVNNKEKIYKELTNILGWYYGEYNPKIYDNIKAKTFAEAFNEKDLNVLYGVDKFVNSAIDKLKQDKYLDINGKITFEGILFYLEGGYTEKSKKESIQKNIQIIMLWAIPFLTLGLLISELWHIFHHLHWE